MTTADQLAIINRILHAPVEAYVIAQAGLVIDWVKSKRILVLARCSTEEALFIFVSQSFPLLQQSDLTLEKALPINSSFRFEIDSDGGSGPDAVYITVSVDKQKLLFEMLPGPHTQNFVSEMYRLSDNLSRKGESSTDFSWLDKYKSNSKEGGTVLLRENGRGAGGSSSLPDRRQDDGIPRRDIATGLAAPIVGRDRESVANYQMSTKEDEFTNLRRFTFFVGTWNVNGQSPGEEDLRAWLAVDEKAPDVYAIGFQELDLSKEAFVFPESPKEDEWMKAVAAGLHPDANYTLVRHIRLVGMLLIIYAKSELTDYVSNVSVDTVGTGIMGKLGNKGGVGARLRFHASDVCFVNSHLAAHVEEFERRNQDYCDICARMNFVTFEKLESESVSFGALRIKDHDNIFWLGDLNYRLAGLDTEEVKEYLRNNNLQDLQKNDQFYLQRHQRKVFVGYKEGEIRFLPTYKYDPGTNTWDTSEKARPPAWTDRVLWQGENIKQTHYRSHMDLMVSDHKPVSAVFDVDVKVIDKEKRQKIREEIMKQLDMLENDFLPQVMVDTNEIKFGTVKFLEPCMRSLAIANTGQVPVQFEFIQKLNEESYCKAWLVAEPSSGFIMPGEKCEVNLRINVDKTTAHMLNAGKDKLYDILVLHLLGGKDIFITVSGDYDKSCFGCSIDSLVRLKVPIAQLSPGQVLSLESGEFNKLPESFLTSPTYEIPKEIWFLCDMMQCLGLGQENLFLQPGDRQEILTLRDWLDTGLPKQRPVVSIHSVAEAMLILLESLKEPVIPYSMLNRCLECSGNYLQCKQIVSRLPPNHKHLFDYLIAFLREVFARSYLNGIDPKILATLFCTIFLRDPPDASYRSKTSQQMVERKKTNFVYHFITNPVEE